MRASPTTETLARTICRRINAKRDVFSSSCIDTQDVLDIQSGLALAVERGWLARREADTSLRTRDKRSLAGRGAELSTSIRSTSE